MKFLGALLLCLPCIAGAQMPASESYLGIAIGNLGYDDHDGQASSRNVTRAAHLAVPLGLGLRRLWRPGYELWDDDMSAIELGIHRRLLHRIASHVA